MKGRWQQVVTGQCFDHPIRDENHRLMARMIRAACAGVAHALTTAMDDGHCGLPRDDLIA
ncbi:hypothetical protein [Sphingomonas bacterium]|uniref:hypothetical protein n=1 Tax=Sphingomonas bacterium TaxID=1895847 RepID=UPI001C2D80F9|nr:hypothetical protein [Sphingomonas bacterium]